MKEINTKKDLISSLSYDMFCQSDSYYDIFYCWSNAPFMENYINNYYANFKDILKDIKIYFDIILKRNRFYLEYARANIIHYNLQVSEEMQKEALNVMTSTYKKWLDILLNDGLNMKRNIICIDGFNKYINKQDILTVIYKDKDLNEVLEALSFSVTMICSNINVVIDEIDMLNKYLRRQSANELNKQLVTNIHTEFFTALRNSIEKSDVDTNPDLREKLDDEEDRYYLIKSCMEETENFIDNEEL